MPDPHATPAMQQYYRFKQRHPGCVLLFRIGDFYEMFNDDAVQVSKAIGLTLTQRTEGIPMAGVPFHQLETYLRRLTTKGFRVAVCEQLVEASSVKGVVPRAVTRVITPGTLVDEALLEGDASVAVGGAVLVDGGPGGRTAREPRVALAVADVSTGSFHVLECAQGGLRDELARRGVRELLYPDDQSAAFEHGPLAQSLVGLRVQGLARPAWHARAHEALEALTTQFKVKTLQAFGLDTADPCIRAAGLVLRYLQETQTIGEDEAREASVAIGKPVQRGSLAHLTPPKRETSDDRLVIDAVSVRSLEVERTLREVGIAPGERAAGDGTLLGVFAGAPVGSGACRTSMGKRALRDWLVRPLRGREAIAERHGIVAALASQRPVREALGERLCNVQDVARIAGRVSLARATPRDIVALARSVRAASETAGVIGDVDALARRAADVRECAAMLKDLPARVLAWCVDDPPPHLREGGLIRDGVDRDLDEARLLERDAGAWLAAYQERLIGEHRLPSLKVGYNKVAGYFIELPSAQARTAPAELKRMQTLRNAERFTTPELSEFERKVTTAQSRAIERERVLFLQLCEEALSHVHTLTRLGEAVGELDVLLAFADKAHHRGWVRPTMVDEPTLLIEQGRHPVLDESLAGTGEACVANDCVLGERGESEAATPALAIITGPNMAGKSTYIRQVALLTLLAHAGSFVPAKSATIGIVDRIFTRIGADDALHAGQSTFMVEMIETASILHHATPQSLVVLDEVGRGSSTLDGLSLAWAIVEHLAGVRERGPRCLFATHYHELTTLEERMADRVTNLHVAVREWHDPQNPEHAEIVFLHRILPGKTDQSYGLHVARLAGMPKGVVTRAREVLGSLTVQQQHDAGSAQPVANDGAAKKRGKADTSRIPAASRSSDQLTLFKEYVPHPALDALREVKLDTMTPMQAFDALRRLRELAEERAPGDQS